MKTKAAVQTKAASPQTSTRGGKAAPWKSGVETRIVRRLHKGTGVPVEIPVATITGRKRGPTFAVTAGMHGGEYNGLFACQKLIQTVKPSALTGRLIVVPVTSTQAFMMRSMQLSPIDEKEVHFQLPGNPGGTYSECLIDTLFSIVKDANYLIDMHAGEFAQALHPWVPVPVAGSPQVLEDSKSIAAGFRVDYLEMHDREKQIPNYAEYLCEHGIANVWTEIGRNGLVHDDLVEVQYDGVISALQTFGMLSGKPARPHHKWIGSKRVQINAEQSGVWRSAVHEGQIVEKGQLLGEMKDYFGNMLQKYQAPFRGIILYYWSSPAINHRRRPDGYDWHSGLVVIGSLAEDEA